MEINIELNKDILELFSTWAGHFKNRLDKIGINGLVKEYKQIVNNIRNQSCQHGNNNSILTGDYFQNCCGISYEYFNDISVRTALEMIINHLPNEKAKLLKIEINKTDKILKDLILENKENKIDRTVFYKSNWWEKALPKGVIE